MDGEAAAFSGRVTRSRAAAATTGGTSSKSVQSRAKAVTPPRAAPKAAVAKDLPKACADLKVKRSQPSAGVGSSKVSSVSSSGISASVKESQSKQKTKASDLNVKRSQPSAGVGSSKVSSVSSSGVSAAVTVSQSKQKTKVLQSMKGDLPSGSMSILFSFYDHSGDESLVFKLGGKVVYTVGTADVLVTDKLRRTVKLLCAVGRGLPIVSPSWLSVSMKAGKLLDPWQHLLKDAEGELKFGVDLSCSLNRAAQKKLLEGFTFCITPNVEPEPEEIKAIISSCGGEVFNRYPPVWPEKSCLISCNDDKPKWINIKNKTTVVTVEWLLSVVLRQDLNFEANLLVE